MIKITLFVAILLFVFVASSLISNIEAKRLYQRLLNNQKNKNQQKYKYGSTSATSSTNPENVCMGEFEMCSTGECSLLKSACKGICPAGHYICPTDPKNPSAPQPCAKKFSECPNLKGTFWDWTLDTETRLDLLSSLVSIDDQSKQLTNFAPAIDSLYVPSYQWLNDDVHQLRGNWTTSFPDGCGLGSTWDAELLGQVGYTISREAREVHHFYTSRGIRGQNPTINGIGLTAYAPNINLKIKPRWGRNQEVYSEDPTQTKILARSYIKGMQYSETSNVTGRSYLQGIACAKHWLAYDVEDFPTVRYKYDAIVDGRNLYETYLPAFFESVVNAGVRSVMPSYNAINGIPTACDGNYMQYLMRGKWNYTGWFVSDYDAWANILWTHAYVPTMADAAAIGINNGMDQEGGGWTAISELPTCLAKGTVKAATVTASFKRLFRARIELGMFDPPEFLSFFSNLNSANIGDDKHEQLSLQTALESATLLRNQGDNTIPLFVTEGNEFTLVVGPKAASTNWIEGNYATKPRSGTISVLEGIMNFMCPWDNAWDMNATYGYSIFVTPEWTQQYPPLVNVETLKDCQDTCEQNLRCNYYTYMSKSKECYLLPVQGSLVPASGAISGSRHGLVVVKEAVSYVQGDEFKAPSIPADDARECSQRCRADPDCARFTYDGALSRCFLLAASSKTPSAAPTTTVSGDSPVKCPNIKYVELCENSDLHCTSPTTVDQAVTLAASAVQTIAVFGLDQTFESEGHDRRTIELPSIWYSIISQLNAATVKGGGKLVGVLVHGGSFPIDLNMFDGLIDMMYPGQQGGRAVAEVLFGGYAPAGRTTSTWYLSDADLPANLAYQNLYPNATTGFKGVSYRYFTGTPNIPFGFGLTLTKFAYSGLEIYPPQISGCQVVNVSFTVTAVGGRFMGYSDEVAQVYIKQSAFSPTVPVPQVRLVNFTRIKNVPSGNGVRVTLQITPRDRTVVFQNDATPHLSEEMLVDGGFNVYVGGGQPDYYENRLEGRVEVKNGSPLNVDMCN